MGGWVFAWLGVRVTNAAGSPYILVSLCRPFANRPKPTFPFLKLATRVRRGIYGAATDDGSEDHDHNHDDDNGDESNGAADKGKKTF